MVGEEMMDHGFSEMGRFRSGEAPTGAVPPMNFGHLLGPESVRPSDVIVSQVEATSVARSEVPSVSSSVSTPARSSTSEDAHRLSRCLSLPEGQEHDPFSSGPDSELGPSVLQSTAVTDFPRAESTSTLSSRVGDVVEGGHLDSDSAPESPDHRPPVWRGHSAQTILPILHPEPSRPTSVPIRSRRDGPGYPSYPNQSFSALQSQIYTPSYPPRPLKARNSHSSQSSLNTSSVTDSRHPPTMASGAKTVGSTPIHSPRLFTPTMSRNRASGDESEDSHYNTPLLHHTHLQAPIE